MRISQGYKECESQQWDSYRTGNKRNFGPNNWTVGKAM